MSNMSNSKEIAVTLSMPIEIWQKLNYTVQWAQDEGPQGEGWASPELNEVRNVIQSAYEEAMLSA